MDKLIGITNFVDMTRTITILLLAVMAPALLHAQGGTAPAIVPEPAQIQMAKGSLRAGGAVFKCDPGIDSLSLGAINRFAARLSLVSGRTSSVSTPIGLQSVVADGSVKGFVFLRDGSLAKGGYSISIGHKAALIRSGSTEGFLNAVQTLKQMLPEAIYGEKVSEKEKWSLPCCEISDRPESAERGLKLDSSSEFWSVERIMGLLDDMAKYKFNSLLWHIADSDGWRMEVRAYPLLAQVAGYRMESSGRYGGYYSQEDISRVVRYAESLGISIIPELSIGGRIVSDSELRPAGTQPEAFLKQIMKETARMFPGGTVSLSDEEYPDAEGVLSAYGKSAAAEAVLAWPEVKPGEQGRIGELSEKVW